MSPSIHIGTSGWHYKHWKGKFYSLDIAAQAMLTDYARQFNSVEINNSFYRLPTTEAVHTWVGQVPSEFVFSLKASRYITHNRKLKDAENSPLKFLMMAKGFGKKLGPILFQLPPSWKANEQRLEDLSKSCRSVTGTLLNFVIAHGTRRRSGKFSKKQGQHFAFLNSMVSKVPRPSPRILFTFDFTVLKEHIKAIIQRRF